MTLQVAGAGHALEAGVQPQGEEDIRAKGRLAGVTFDGLDAGMESGEIELLDQVPDGANLMVGGELLIEGSVRAMVAVQQSVTRCGLRKFHKKRSQSKAKKGVFLSNNK
jgi:hypothetical protein